MHILTRTRTVIIIMAVSTMFLGTAAACASSGDNQAAGTSGSDGASGNSGSSNSNVTVKIDVLESSLGTALFPIAQSLGAFKKQGITVKPTAIQSGQENNGVQELVQGRTDFAFITATSVAALDSAYVAKGEPAPLIAVAATRNVSNVVVSSKVDYTGLDDLRGLTIGVSHLTSAHRINFDYYLGQQGTSADKLGIKYVPVSGSDMPAALASGQIDGFIHSEPTTAIAVTKDNAKLAIKMGGPVHDQATSVLAVNSEYLAAHKDVVGRMVAALRSASERFPSLSDDKVAQIYAHYTSATPDLMKSVIAQKDFDPTLAPLHVAADAFWEVSVPPSISRHLIDPKLTEKDVFNYSFSE